MDDPNEALSGDALVLKIQNGEIDPLALTTEVLLRIVQHLRSHPEGQWTFQKIATLIKKSLRTVKRYEKEMKRRRSVVVDDDWLKSKMGEAAFEYKRQYDRLVRLSYSPALSDSAKARVISLALTALMRSSEQAWKQYWECNQREEKARPKTEIQKKDEPAEGGEHTIGGQASEAIKDLLPIERTAIATDFQYLLLAEKECLFTSEDFQQKDQIRELLDAIKRDYPGIKFDESLNLLDQLNSIRSAIDFPAICLEKKMIDRNCTAGTGGDKWNSLIDCFTKSIAGKTLDQLSIKERTSLMRLNRMTLEKIYADKCPKAKCW